MLHLLCQTRKHPRLYSRQKDKPQRLIGLLIPALLSPRQTHNELLSSGGPWRVPLRTQGISEPFQSRQNRLACHRRRQHRAQKLSQQPWMRHLLENPPRVASHELGELEVVAKSQERPELALQRQWQPPTLETQIQKILDVTELERRRDSTIVTLTTMGSTAVRKTRMWQPNPSSAC